MRWINTDFGYYALCPVELLPSWTGNEADGTVLDDVAGIEFLGRDVVTLSGEPLEVAWIPERFSFVRWISADGDGGIAEGLDAALGDPSRWEHCADVRLGGRYRLIDSACPGDYPHAGESIDVDLPDALYRILSLALETPDGEFRVDRLEPVPPARG
ncbi:Imm21 family immunity protein [Kitasatospora sp. NPDC057692]|uniref:Imm21 family immunity protein n=1 Tax=Kitasatospora sp. NPDC057692 TaxID=3346215 RepID=UPI0036AAC4E7